MPQPRPPRPYSDRFKVAFSFAGEQRDLVEKIAVAVEKQLGVGSVFYDDWFEAFIAGDGSDLELQNIYARRADLVVVCVSGNYEAKSWTKIEYEAIRALQAEVRASANKKDRLRVLPIRVGEGEVEGFFPITICPDARSRSPEQMAQLIVERLQAWSGFTPAVFTPKGAALLMPAVAKLAGAVEAVETWLEDASIAVLRLNPNLAGADRTLAIEQAVAQADIVVDWAIEASPDPLDAQFLQMAAEIRAAAARVPGKRILRWLPMELKATETESKELSTRRYHLEPFKKEVLKLIEQPAAPANPAAGSRVVIAAAGTDAAGVEEIVLNLPPGRGRDARVDDAHCPPAFGQTPNWDEEIKDALRRKGVAVAVFIDGGCRRDWIDRRLRAYDVYREELPGNFRLIVWDRPQPTAKEPRFFWPDYAERVGAATEVIGLIPP